jgi:hypothetical protein
MHYREANVFNRCFARDPYNFVPPALAATEEIISPDKMVAALDSLTPDFLIAEIGGAEWWARKAPWRHSYGDTLATSHFYFLGDDDMLETSKTLADNNIDAWLQTWHANLFIVTCPVMTVDNGLRTIPFSTSYGIQNNHSFVYISSEDDLLEQLIVHNCFTIGSGLILALALTRAGRISRLAMRSAIVRLRQNLFSIIPQNVPAKYNPLFANSAIPHVCDIPDLFMAGDPMFNHILSLEEANQPNMETIYILRADPVVTYVTTRAISSFPHFDPRHHRGWPIPDEPLFAIMDSDLPMRHSPDWYGFVLSVANQKNRALWRWWKQNADCFLELVHKDIKAPQQIMFALFHLYNSGHPQIRVCRYRIRRIWQSFLAWPEITPRWLTRILLQRHVRATHSEIGVDAVVFGHLRESQWQPAIPIPFFRDMMSHYGDAFPIFEKRCYKVLVCGETRIQPRDDLLINYAYLGDEEDKYELHFETSLWNLLCAAERGSTLYYLARELGQKITDRLTVVHTAFNTPTFTRMSSDSGFTLWTIMRHHFKQNRMVLIT